MTYVLVFLSLVSIILNIILICENNKVTRWANYWKLEAFRYQGTIRTLYRNMFEEGGTDDRQGVEQTRIFER